ncbi:tyrosine-type recombinase/integrase [Streptomyces sp. NPDC059071]|uniref:tyrosine-type recombinase/integrase n=1 Tax=unclassified Streptomyces TaxID=2593676 RepID=UPI0036567EBB
MAGHVQDRWYKTETDADGKERRVRTDRYGVGMRYRARYVGPDGTEKSKSFPDKQKRLAEQWLAQIEADMSRGQYIDPKASRITFRQYAERWLNSQLTDPNTRGPVETQIRRHAIPYLGMRPIDSFEPIHIREWLASLEKDLPASSYRRVIFSSVSSIFASAVEDRLRTTNPCRSRSVKPPERAAGRVEPWSAERVSAVRASLPRRFQCTVDVGGGSGLRQGEIFGLPEEHINFSTGWIHVGCQIKSIGGKQVFALPKRRKVRDTPMARPVGRAIQAHIEEFPPVEVTLPWERPDGPLVTKRLVFTRLDGGAVRSGDFNSRVWKPALVAAGVIPPPTPGERYKASREDGMHALRHFFASVVLAAGESIKALSRYLGHSDPGFTLRVYTHLLAGSAERSLALLDNAFAHGLDGLYAALLLQAVEKADLAIPDSAFRDDVAVLHLHGGRYGDAWVMGVQESASSPVLGEVRLSPAPDQPMAAHFGEEWLRGVCERQGLTVLSTEDLSHRYGPDQRPYFVLTRAVVATPGGSWTPAGGGPF